MTEREGRVAVVLGATGSIGAAVARRLVSNHASLVLGYQERLDRAEALAADLRAGGAAVQLVAGNLAEPSTKGLLVDAVKEFGERCDSLVHCVALTSFKPLREIRANQWSLILDVSARSFLDSVVALTEPLARAGGSVVALSSQGGPRYVPNYGALGPAKAALESIVRHLACELAPRGIRVNAVRAGLIESETAERFPAEVRESVLHRTPLARLGTPEDVAGAVACLLSRDASWVVGQVLDVDGGFSIT